MRLIFWAGFWAFLVDQLSKYVIYHILRLETSAAPDLGLPFVSLGFAWNEGINFGLFSNEQDWMRWLLIGLAGAISALVLYWMRTEQGNRLALISAGLLIGGALGNVIDRLMYGAVIDFLNVTCCGINNPYVFNIADIAIFVGAVGLVLFTGKNDAETKTS
jgi:signal peptidase II